MACRRPDTAVSGSIRHFQLLLKKSLFYSGISGMNF
jgi:hypothetical protein